MGRLDQSKYLSRQAEPEASLLERMLANYGPWQHFIGVPVYAEHPRYQDMLVSIDQLQTVAANGKILLLLLVNENSGSPEDYRQQNRLTLEALKTSESIQLCSSPVIWLRHYSAKVDIVWIDRTDSWQFPEKQGVGLARKIIADCGLSLWSAGLVLSQWIHNTDADARLPQDYLQQAAVFEGDPHAAALLYQYRHIAEEGNDSAAKTQDHWLAAQQYETWLRYYELGLDYANSPYAIPTIGSTITIDARSYDTVRGFPRRSAGEDFYLLNKLAKVGMVQVLGGTPIILTDRPSDRVPFGTGQGTAKIKDLRESGQDFMVYHPLVFDGLQLVLKAATQCLREAPMNFSEIASQYATKSALPEKFQVLEAASAYGFAEACVIANKQGRDFTSRFRQFHVWFDAFRTLKWVHLLRDRIYGSLSLDEALSQAAFIHTDHDEITLSSLRKLQDKPRCRGLYTTESHK